MAGLTTFRRASGGQALMEFTLSLPLILLVLLVTFMIGEALYTGNNAATAVKSAIENKYDFADSDQAVNDLRNTVNNYNLGSFQVAGNNVDQLVIQHSDRERAVITAMKSIKLTLLPRFNFVVTQSLDPDLLRNNSGAFQLATAIPYAAPAPINAVPFGWDPPTLPQEVPINNDCTNADLTNFSSAVNTVCTDATCFALNAQALVDDYVNEAETGFAACSSPFTDTGAVQFESNPNY